MELPRYTITNLILTYIIRYEVSLDRVKNTPLPSKYHDSLKTELATEDIHNLATLINTPIGLDEAERVYKGKTLPSKRSEMQIFTNYKNSLDFAQNYDINSFTKPSAELLSHLNSIISNKLDIGWELNKFRNFSDKPNVLYDEWTDLRDYYPSLEPDRYLDELLEFTASRGREMHPLIKMAYFLYEMIDKVPLRSFNQISSISMLWVLSQVHQNNHELMLSWSKVINFIRDDLLDAHKISKSKKDLTTFFEAFLYSSSVEATNLDQKIASLFKNKVKKHGKLSKELNSRQIRIVDHLEQTARAQRDDFRKLLGVSFMTVYRDLQYLLDKDYLEKEGKGRATYYSLKRKAQPAESKKVEVLSDIQ